LAQAVVTLADDAVDATVGAGSVDDWFRWDGHGLRADFIWYAAGLDPKSDYRHQ